MKPGTMIVLLSKSIMTIPCRVQLLHTTRVHGPCPTAHGPWTRVSKMTSMSTGRVHGPCVPSFRVTLDSSWMSTRSLRKIRVPYRGPYVRTFQK